MKQYVIAADIGTTSTKAVVISSSGVIVAEQSVGYPLNAPVPGAAEQDPGEIMQAAVSAIRMAIDASGIPQSEILCISMSSAMHSLIALDQSDELLTQCITWADNRSAPYVNTLRERYDAQAIYAATGTPIHPMSPLLKLMWMKEKDPAAFAKARKFVGIKEYILNRWFGKLIVDESIASATGLYSLKERKWHKQSLEAAGITEDGLPELVPTTHVLEGMRPEWADRLGVPRDVPVVIGASDGVLANLGVGAVTRDSFAVTIGTSGAVRAVVDQPLTDPYGRTFCYSLTPGRWVIGGAINNGGVLFRWVRRARHQGGGSGPPCRTRSIRRADRTRRAGARRFGRPGRAAAVRRRAGAVLERQCARRVLRLVARPRQGAYGPRGARGHRLCRALRRRGG